MDGKRVSSKHYTKESGSVIIRLKPNCLNKLKNGKHTITAEFDDGAADASFRVAGNKSGGSGGARTGDENDILAWLAVMLASILSMIVCGISRRKRNSR